MTRRELSEGAKGWLLILGMAVFVGLWAISRPHEDGSHPQQVTPVYQPAQLPASLTSLPQRPAYPVYPAYTMPTYRPLPSFYVGGTVCGDGSVSGSSGRGTCSHHGGIRH